MTPGGVGAFLSGAYALVPALTVPAVDALAARVLVVLLSANPWERT